MNEKYETYQVLDLRIDGERVKKNHCTNEHVYVELPSGEKRRLPLANLMKHGQHQVRTNDQELVTVQNWPEVVEQCPECGSDFIRTPSDYRVCPDGHGGLWPARPSDVEDAAVVLVQTTEGLVHMLRMLSDDIKRGESRHWAATQAASIRRWVEWEILDRAETIKAFVLQQERQRKESSQEPPA